MVKQTPNTIKQEKNKEWWESAPMTYEDWDKNKEERMPKRRGDFVKIEEKFLESNPFLKLKFNFNLFKNKKVLEIGCGSGVASCLFAKGQSKVTGIDITKEAVNMAKKNAEFQNLKIKIFQKDAEKMGFPDESFDYIFSWGVLHHSQNPTNTFKEVSRILRKKGRGLIMVYNKNSLRYYINGLNWLFLKGKIWEGYSLKKVQSLYTDGYYHQHFTPKELKKELKRFDLGCKKITITHMNTKMISFLPRKVVQFLKNKFGWLLVIEFEKEQEE